MLSASFKYVEPTEDVKKARALAVEHYLKIVSDTGLLIQYCQAMGEDELESVIYYILRRIRELEGEG
jgi:hypothetical protein